MKTPRTLIVLALLAFFSYTSAQVSENANNNLPDWSAQINTERYYYIPDIETYYDISTREYIYLQDGIWTRSSNVPTIYRNYDFYRGRKIAIDDYNGNAPYAFYNVHRVKYVPARPQKPFVQSQSATRRIPGNTYTRESPDSRAGNYSRGSGVPRGNAPSRSGSTTRSASRR